MSKAVAGFTRTRIAQSRVQRANQETTVFFDVGDLKSIPINEVLTYNRAKFCIYVNPLHPYIRMHNLHTVLHTVLYTVLKVLTRRICLPIKSFFRWRSFPLFS